MSSGLPPGSGADVAAKAVASGQLPPELAAHVGATFVDGGHYVWRIEGDGSFVCVAQPPGAEVNSVGARVKAAESAELWQSLCGIALAKLAPSAVPDEGAGAPAAEPAEPATGSGGFSLEGFLAGLFAAGNELVDVGSRAGHLVTGAVDGLIDTVGSILGFGSGEPAPSGGSPGEDVANDGDGAEAAPPAPAGPAPTPAPAEPAPATPASDKERSGVKWPSLATKKGWIGTRNVSDLAGEFGTAVQKFIAALEAAGANVEIVSTYRHENRAYLMHYAWTVAHGDDTPADANAACAAQGIDIEWDHGDANTTKAAASAMAGDNGFDIVAKPALGTLHKTREAIDMKITGVPAQITIDGVARDTEPKTQGRLDEDKVDHIGRDLGVLWFGPDDYVHWSVNGK